MVTFVTMLLLLAASVVSSLFPMVNAEALIVGSVLTAPRESALLISVVVTLGQVAGKCVLYGCGARIGSLTSLARSERAKSLAERLRNRRTLMIWTLSASAFVGIPPLYVMSVACGIVGLPMRAFVPTLLAGRFLRFYGLALVFGLF